MKQNAPKKTCIQDILYNNITIYLISFAQKFGLIYYIDGKREVLP